MSDDSKHKDQERLALAREKRRAEQLRANLMRRKAQTRSRRAGEEDNRRDGIITAPESATDDEN